MHQLLRQENADELMPVLARQAALYAMGNSSLPAEIAAGLAASVLFCVRMGGEGKATTRFGAGQKRAAQLAARCKGLVHAVQQTRPTCANLAYNSTVSSIAAGLPHYSPRFFAHTIPADIDYPLCMPVDDAMEGPEYLQEYLRRLLCENRLCACFVPAMHLALLHSAGPQQAYLVRSISVPLLLNATGLVLLGRSPVTLDVTGEDRQALAKRLTPQAWATAAQGLPAALGIAGGATAGYIAAAAAAQWPVHPGLLHSLARGSATQPECWQQQ